MRQFFSAPIGKLISIVPTLFLAFALLAPVWTSAAISDQASLDPEANNPNNLLDTNACQNFSTDGAKTEAFQYVLNGSQGEVSATMYPDLVKCLNKLKMETSKPDAVHAVQEDTDDALTINNIPQTNSLKELADNIEKVTPDKNDQARIAASIVQKFKYEDKDKNSYNYPYEVAFDQKGICNETAKLIVNLLKQLGFGAAMLTFEKDDHQAAGIKCDPQYSYQGTGYCFIEPTTRAIITDSLDTKSETRVNVVSDGLTFDASKDFQDAQNLTTLSKEKRQAGLESNIKDQIDNLKKQYGLES